MRYREHAVPANLAAAVETIWTLEARAEPAAIEPEAVVPDGRAEIIVHFGDRFDRIDAGVASTQAPMLFAGQIDRPLWLRPSGRVSMLGIRLRPEGIAAFTPMPAADLTNRTPAVADVAPDLGCRLDEVRDARRRPDDAVEGVLEHLAARVRVDRIDARVAHAAAMAARPGVTVEAMASATSLTRRQLERLFQAQVGTTPRMLVRIRRLQRAMALLSAMAARGSRRPGTDTAAAAGYADQAHFVRDFTALTGTTPSAHLVRQAALTGVFLR